MKAIIKIMVAISIIVWFALEVSTVPAGQIVSTEKVPIDNTTKEIKIVNPDEIQRIETDRDDEMSRLQGRVAVLELRVAKLESQINQ